MKQFIISAAIALALPAVANAHAIHKDIVIDSNGNQVRDSFGGCVRTKWDTTSDKCGAHGHCQEHHLAMVFFDFDKADLRKEAYSTVHKLYKETKQNRQNVMFKVVGHTDTVGSAKYNKGLSVRRAQSVKKELMKEGIPASHIKVEGHGFNELMVPTPAGVPESKNRRAEICYSIY